MNRSFSYRLLINGSSRLTRKAISGGAWPSGLISGTGRGRVGGSWYSL